MMRNAIICITAYYICIALLYKPFYINDIKRLP